MEERPPAGGNILVFFRVHDPDARSLMRGVLENAGAERVTPSIYELDTSDWEECDWDDELRRMEDLIDPRTDAVIVWQVVEGRLARTSLAGRE